ncbi:acetolactate synthase, partial [Rhizobiaceae sp. 2RAB30]
MAIDTAEWPPIEPMALTQAAVERILHAFEAAERPLVVTSYLGRNPQAVGELVRFCETLGAGVLESVPNAMNFPHDHPLYRGNQWNEPRQNAALAEADCI